MLIKFYISNFLSFNEKQEFSMTAGKSRKCPERIFTENNLKLVKFKVIMGGNATGKSNLVEAFDFAQEMITQGLPSGFSNKYFRQDCQNQNRLSEFAFEILLENKHIFYGFSIILKTGSLQHEYLYELKPSGSRKLIYDRDLQDKTFSVGGYFRKKSSIEKLLVYGEDSLSDSEILFLTIMNHGKSRMYEENPDLAILQHLFQWFKYRLTVNDPDSMLRGYSYFSEDNLKNIASLLNALGTGITELKIVELTADNIKSRIPTGIFNEIVSDLERRKARNPEDDTAIMIRAEKDFYTFEMNGENNLVITSIEFCHEKKDIFFDFQEESDGTVRILDLLEILLSVSDDTIFVIDEIDRCLHPSLTTNIVKIFLDLAKQRNTQLIATSHESRLLDEDILRNDEICFIIKDNEGKSIINPLEKRSLRSDKKVYAALFDNTLEDLLPKYDEKKIHETLNEERQMNAL